MCDLLPRLAAHEVHLAPFAIADHGHPRAEWPRGRVLSGTHCACGGCEMQLLQSCNLSKAFSSFALNGLAMLLKKP